jgi:hypothetical protein
MPQLRFGRRAPFRLATVGGMYPWGAVRVAEANFGAAMDGRSGFKLMVVKVSGHVFEPDGDDPHYGPMQRYGGASTACGALNVLLERPTPLLHELEESLTADGFDRLEVLRDPERVEPKRRMLFAALVSARLQARRVVLDLQDNVQRNATYWLVLPCVSLNRGGRDSEILVGVYTLDHRTQQPIEDYRGLGDDPLRYQVVNLRRPLRVVDDQVTVLRKARNHRHMVRERLRELAPAALLDDPRLQDVRADVKAGKHHGSYAKVVLKMLLHGLAQTNPVTAAMALFADGIAGIHHAHRVHKLAETRAQDWAEEHHEQARRVLRDLRQQLDAMPPERAREVVEKLAGMTG